MTTKSWPSLSAHPGHVTAAKLIITIIVSSMLIKYDIIILYYKRWTKARAPSSCGSRRPSRKTPPSHSPPRWSIHTHDCFVLCAESEVLNSSTVVLSGGRGSREDYNGRRWAGLQWRTTMAWFHNIMMMLTLSSRLFGTQQLARQPL